MTLKKLQKIQKYITDYQIEVSEKDVEIANKAIKKMYRRPKQLSAGDIVEFTNQYGEFSKHAIIERIDGKDVSVCQSGSAWCSSSKRYVSVSGGSFYTVPKSDLVYIGRSIRYFSEWGSCGACARGAISIPVTVNVWRNKTDLKNTTEFYDQHYIYPYSEEYKKEYNCNYDYGEFSKNAWTSNAELSAWCFLHRAFIEKERSSGDGYNFLVWTWKHRVHYWCNDEEVMNMDGYHDLAIMNGCIRNVCYVYDEENKMIDVYYGNNKIECTDYRSYRSKHFQNAKDYVLKHNIHFPESFVKEMD